jgi:hypothetical protein
MRRKVKEFEKEEENIYCLVVNRKEEKIKRDPIQHLSPNL